MNSIQIMNIIIDLVTSLEDIQGVNRAYTKDEIIKVGAIIAATKGTNSLVFPN